MSYYVSITTHSRIIKSTMIHFLFSCYSYPTFWNVNYLAISSSTYFFTAFSATVLSSFAIGTVFTSSYSAWGSWIIYINISKKIIQIWQQWKHLFISKKHFTLIKYISHNSYYYIIPQWFFYFSYNLLKYK